ncbi:MAG: ABC transporter permease [Brucellaceae bacterium]|jgi:putative spermidine/putrescine transport system permease protein|nr:ABC transporter permease [Brucellaceae bacterium]
MSELQRQRLKSFALVAPLALFLLVFFIIPLVTMMKEAVSDPVAAKALPLTAHAVKDWSVETPPTPEMKAALAEDIRNNNDAQLFGDLVRRLNSAQPGFRTLMSKTRTQLEKLTEPVDYTQVDLTAIDKKWGEQPYWQAIATAASTTLTDRNLLAAVDMERDISGEIRSLPSDASANVTIMVRTFVTALSVTIACILIGIPFAMVAASVEGWKRQLLLGAVLLPLWTSLLVRTAAWFILLQDQGLINNALIAIGIASEPLALIFNRTGVVIAMTHVLLPFMVLPVFSVLIGIPKNLMPAAASLGAHPLRSFFHVLLPLIMRGVVSGSLLVFMTALGYYITPALIGGAKDQLISSVIAFYAMGAANWGMAGALGMVLLIATILLYTVYMRLSTEKEVRS